MKTAIILFFLVLSSSISFSLNPSRTYKQKPEKYNMLYKEVKVKTSEGAELNTWLFEAKTKSTKLVLLSHNGEGNMGDYLRRVDQFKNLGYNVMTYDYRGFGESSEFEIDNNMFIYPHFQDDITAMIDYCKTQFSEIVMYGWGIGAGLTLGVGYHAEGVTHIIADSPFLTLEDFEIRMQEWDEPMEVSFAGYEKKHEPFYTLDIAPKNSLKKIMLIIGSNDVLFKSEDMKTLADKQKKLFAPTFIVENPDRIDNFKVDKAAYFKKIEEMLLAK